MMNKFPKLDCAKSQIYNAKARYRLEVLAGRTPIQALMDDLIMGGLIYRLLTLLCDCQVTESLFIP